jgi:hypothetical protein
MRKWMPNFISVDRDGNPGVCPCCGSDNTDYVIVQNPDIIKIWCNDCKIIQNMRYRGQPQKGRKVMSGDEYNKWDESDKEEAILKGIECGKKFACPMCGTPNQLWERYNFDRCMVCGWDDDGWDKYPDEEGANGITFNEAKRIWESGQYIPYLGVINEMNSNTDCEYLFEGGEL